MCVITFIFVYILFTRRHIFAADNDVGDQKRTCSSFSINNYTKPVAALNGNGYVNLFGTKSASANAETCRQSFLHRWKMLMRTGAVE